jgi:hypothetical protein
VDCPFLPGRRYRVKRSFKAWRDEFRVGEELVFRGCGESRYDGMSGYFFTEPGTETYRSWDISYRDDVKVWTELFELLPVRAGNIEDIGPQRK